MAHRQLRGHGQVVIFRRLQRMNRRDKVQATGSILVEMLTRGSLVQVSPGSSSLAHGSAPFEESLQKQALSIIGPLLTVHIPSGLNTSSLR
jgi:hypothetical protein